MKKILKLFKKHQVDLPIETSLSDNAEARFLLKADGIVLAILYRDMGMWYFKYTDEFKNYSHVYNYIIGFPDLDRIYQSSILWPFFQVRIPGLKQPAVQEILKKENIDQKNEVALLKRFGAKTITNPFELVIA